MSARRSHRGHGARLLAFVEQALLAIPIRCNEPVLFVLGLPRSGTTLVSQYLVHRLHLAYFTNGVGQRPAAPLLTTALDHLRHGGYCSDFRSDYGRVEGQNAPREAGSVWGRFFGYERYLRYPDVPASDVRKLRRLVGAVQWIFGGVPFANKNVKHLLRIHALANIFPDSRFVVVRRSPADVALSILRARRKSLADPSQWWSVKPPDYETLRHRRALEQVAGQVLSLQSRMHADLGELADARVLWVDYERFCREPESAIHQVRSSVGDVALRNEPVRAFEIVRHAPVDPEERELVEVLDEYDG